MLALQASGPRCRAAPAEAARPRQAAWSAASTSTTTARSRCASSRRAASTVAAAAPEQAPERLAAPLAPSSSDALGAVVQRRKQFDVVSLSNLCVDVMVPVEELPPNDAEARRRLLQQLTAQPPPEEQWEVGG